MQERNLCSKGMFHQKRSGNQHKTDRFLPKFAFFNDRFSAKFDSNFPSNSREIGCFFREFVSENLTKSDFFPLTIRGSVL